MVLSLRGEVDMQSAPQLSQRLTELAAEAPARVVVDLSGVDFLDSSGLGALLTANQSFQGAGIAFGLAGANAGISKVLTLSRVDEIIGVHSDVESALG